MFKEGEGEGGRGRGRGREGKELRRVMQRRGVSQRKRRITQSHAEVQRYAEKKRKVEE
ncbi:hypothetical protein [Brumimicrobium oceani]|uniref:hypothetical protein n=1 Tax=Brumimicrobium oceani TaxID=2100725 RepID=UPI001304A807|nr:hypothetical protein [Brumimicrobium oceani]